MSDKWKPYTTIFTRKYRRLPHWQSPGAVHHIESRVLPGITLSESDRSIVFDSQHYLNGRKYALHAAVVMPDHFHILCRPLEISPGSWASLSGIKHSLKSFTSHKMKKGEIWQDEAWDRIIRDEEEYIRCRDYIIHNPVEAGLVATVEEYPWVWWEGKED